MNRKQYDFCHLLKKICQDSSFTKYGGTSGTVFKTDITLSLMSLCSNPFTCACKTYAIHILITGARKIYGIHTVNLLILTNKAENKIYIRKI